MGRCIRCGKSVLFGLKEGQWCSKCYDWVVQDRAEKAEAVRKMQEEQDRRYEERKKFDRRRELIHQNIGKIEAYMIDPMSFLDGIKQKSFIAFDTETTGLDPFYAQIIEIGAVKVINGQVVGEFSQLIKPLGDVVPTSATAVNGITTAMVANQPYIHNALPYFMHFIGDLPLVAHNATFDAKILANEMAYCAINKKINFIDSLTISRKIWKTAENHKLGTMAKIVGHDIETAHRALDDAKAVAAIVIAASEAQEALAKEKAEAAKVKAAEIKAATAKAIATVRQGEKHTRVIHDVNGVEYTIEPVNKRKYLQLLHPEKPDLEKENIDLYFNGQEHRKAGKIDLALDIFDQARANGYNAPALYRSYGLAYRKLKDYDNEIDIYDEATRNCPAFMTEWIEAKEKAIQHLLKQRNQAK